MKKILILLIALFAFYGAISQNTIEGDELRVYKGAKIGEDGTIYPLDMTGNKVVNVQNPTDPKDAVNVDYLNTNALINGVPIDSLMFSVGIENLPVEKGKLYFDKTFQSLVFFPDDINSMFIGRSMLNPVVINNTGATIPNLTVVMSDGVGVDIGGHERISINLADKSSFTRSRVIGVTTEAIPNGAIGNVTNFGLIQGNLSSFSGGDKIYCGSEGLLTNIKPTGGDFVIYLGLVKKVGVADGELYVNYTLSDHTAETNNIRGWSVINNNVIAADELTRTISVNPIGSEFHTYEDGIKYTSTGSDLIWSDVEGVHVIYFDKGVLVEQVNISESTTREIFKQHAGVSIMYWDATNDRFIYMNNMRHTLDMNGNTWATFWDLHRCDILENSLNVVDIDTDASGDVDAHAQFGHDSGLIRNQDILTSIPAIASTVGYTLFYRDGVNDWRSQINAGFPVLTAGSGRCAFNENIGGNWQLTEVNNNDFTLIHMLVSNTLGIKTGIILGQNEYATIAAARDGARHEVNDLATTQMPIKEMAFAYTFIIQTSNGYANGVKSRIRTSENEFGETVDFIDWRSTNIIGGGGIGGGTTTFLGATDTPNSYAGGAGKAPTVNIAENGLEFTPVVISVNGITPVLGNHDITMTQNKVNNIVTINTSGTGNGIGINIDDADSSDSNEIQGLSNTKLNNTITITPTLGGAATTITDIARIDFANNFTVDQTATAFVKSGGISTEFLKADGSVDNNTYITSAGNDLQAVTDNGATTTIFTTFTGGVGSSNNDRVSYGLGAALNSVTTSWTAIGYLAAFSAGSANFFTALGNHAGTANSNGTGWTAIGHGAGDSNISGSRWIACGLDAASKLTNGSDAITFSNSVYIGNSTKVSSNGVTNENVFGYEAEGKGINTVTIGNSSISDNFFNGNVDADSYSTNGVERIDIAGNFFARGISTGGNGNNGQVIWKNSIDGVTSATLNTNGAFDFVNLVNNTGFYSWHTTVDGSTSSKMNLSNLGRLTLTHSLGVEGNGEFESVTIKDEVANLNIQSTATLSTPMHSIRFLDFNGQLTHEIQASSGLDSKMRIINETDGILLYYGGGFESDLKFETTMEGAKTSGDHDVTGCVSASCYRSSSTVDLNNIDDIEFSAQRTDLFTTSALNRPISIGINDGVVTTTRWLHSGYATQTVIDIDGTGVGFRARDINNNWKDWQAIYTDLNANLSTVDWTAKDIIASGSGSFGGSVTATVDVNCVDLNYSGSLNQISDQRVKDSIRDFTFNREAFKRLSIKRYSYKADSTNIEYINPMAQALEVEFPWLVNHSKYKIVRNDSIISISTLSEYEKLNIKDEDRLHTIKSMQLATVALEGLRLEMIKNDSLKLQIEVLKSLIQNITDRVDTLEN